MSALICTGLQATALNDNFFNINTGVEVRERTKTMMMGKRMAMLTTVLVVAGARG